MLAPPSADTLARALDDMERAIRAAGFILRHLLSR